MNIIITQCWGMLMKTITINPLITEIDENSTPQQQSY